ncbi:glycosyltransferase family 2 protein [Roseateles sp. BYS78W]|uniref:Glycosyltransferase family 2 protein n=1 Tax=Pelomonas candidula TaxID=3299025 RepID=A0ABW7HIE7_9BURK
MSDISIALPVHNAHHTLAATLDSLVAQSLRDFEVVLLDDASSDDSLEIARRYQDRLALRIIRAEQNLGISGARNRLLAEIDTPFIAILDHDDLCHPERLARQRDFLEQHPEVDIVGSAVAYFSSPADLPAGRQVLRHPAGDAAIKTQLLHTTSMVHPSAMARRSFFSDCGGYQAEFSPAEDYALWCRAALLGKRFANLDEPLLYYRIHASQTSKVQGERMVRMDIEIKRLYVRALLAGSADTALPELFCPYLRHEPRVLAAILPQLMPALLKLGQRVACPDTYAQIVAQVLGRSLLPAA